MSVQTSMEMTLGQLRARLKENDERIKHMQARTTAEYLTYHTPCGKTIMREAPPLPGPDVVIQRGIAIGPVLQLPGAGWRKRRAQRRARTVRDAMNGWWETTGGEWRRDTIFGDDLDSLFDRAAEDYVNDRHATVDDLIARVNATVKRWPHLARLRATPFECPRLEELP